MAASADHTDRQSQVSRGWRQRLGRGRRSQVRRRRRWLAGAAPGAPGAAGQHPTMVPVANRATPTRTAAVTMAARPEARKKGMSGMTAPLAKATKLDPAAAQPSRPHLGQAPPASLACWECPRPTAPPPAAGPAPATIPWPGTPARVPPPPAHAARRSWPGRVHGWPPRAARAGTGPRCTPRRPSTAPRPKLLVWGRAPRRNRTGDPILTMEPPGTAVRTALSPGHARP